MNLLQQGLGDGVVGEHGGLPGGNDRLQKTDKIVQDRLGIGVIFTQTLINHRYRPKIQRFRLAVAALHLI